MDLCMTFIIIGFVWCGFWFLFYYGFNKVAENMMEGAFDTGNAQEDWYDHVRDGGSLSLEEYTAWSEKKARFGQMDLVEQLISELDTPLDMLEGNFEYNEYLSILEPVSGMDAVRRIDQVIDKLVEIGDIRAVEPLIKLAKKREAFRSASAIEALGNFDDKKSIDYLVKSLKDKDKDIRRIAADALDKLEWEPE